MSTDPADFRVEIIKARPQGIVSSALGSPATGDVLDITDRVPRDGFGSINRAAERDLLSFKTGDLTLTLRNHDGYFDDLFAFLKPADSWGMRVYRRGVVQFYGTVIGVGSILFDRKLKAVELTAYGLTKMLDRASANPVSRTFAALTVTTATATQDTLTINDTTGMLTGDVLHVTDQINKEDVTVKQVTSATVVSLEAALVNSYAAGNPVTVTTPYYRYKSVEFLVRALFTTAGFPVADFRMSNSQFSHLAPSPTNIAGLDLTAFPYASPCEIGGSTYVTLSTGQRVGIGTYKRTAPDDDWTLDDATVNPWIDWSRYFAQGSAQPAIMLRNSLAVQVGVSGGAGGEDPHLSGFDYAGTGIFGIPAAWHIEPAGAVPRVLARRTTADGITWGASTTVSNLGGSGAANASGIRGYGCEYDPHRALVYCWWYSPTDGLSRFFVYNTASGVWADLAQTDDAGKSYYGAVYVPELDLILCLRGASWDGPEFEIAAFFASPTGVVRTWVRPFPNCYVVNDDGAILGGANYPTLQLRHVNGSLYCLAISDGALQLIRSDDQFRSYTMRKIADSTSKTYYFGSRVNGQYSIAAYKGTSPRSYLVAAPFYAGVVDYAGFADISVAEALKKLAVLTNAVFWVDDDMQAHFVARDLYDAGAVQDVGDRVVERSDSLLWDETAQYVTVSGNSVEATAGDDSFAAEGIDLSTDLLPNEAFAQALADSYFDFYSKARQYVETEIHDTDGKIYRPLDRVTLGGAERYLVYESDHGLTDDRVQVTLLEDV